MIDSVTNNINNLNDNNCLIERYYVHFLKNILEELDLINKNKIDLWYEY